MKNEGESLAASARTFNEYVHENQQLREQLSAEREKRIETEGEWGHCEARCIKLTEQLDAERVQWSKQIEDMAQEVAELRQQNKTFRAAQKACEDCDGPTMAEVQQLREQLAALADALHFYRNHDDNGQTATDALRKIGK